MDNHQIAGVLESIGTLLDILGENAFKVRAYQTAARTIDGLEMAVQSLIQEGNLRSVGGIGEGLAGKIE